MLSKSLLSKALAACILTAIGVSAQWGEQDGSQFGKFGQRHRGRPVGPYNNNGQGWQGNGQGWQGNNGQGWQGNGPVPSRASPTYGAPLPSSVSSTSAAPPASSAPTTSAAPPPSSAPTSGASSPYNTATSSSQQPAQSQLPGYRFYNNNTART